MDMCMLNVVRGIKIGDRMSMTDWAIPAMFLLLPFTIIVPGLIWDSHRLFFIIMLLPMVAMMIKNVWIKSFFIYAFIWQLFILWTHFGNQPRIHPGSSLTIIASLISAAVIFKFVSESRMANEKWYDIIRIAVLIQIVIAILQFFMINLVLLFMQIFIKAQELMPGHFVGTLGNKDFLTAFIGIAAPLFVGWKSIKWHIVKPFGVDGTYPWDIRINIPLIAIAFILFFGPTPATLAVIFGMAIYVNRGWKPIGLALVVAVCMVYYYVGIQGIHLNEFEALPGQISEFIRTGAITARMTAPEDLGRFGMWFVALGKLLSSWKAFMFGYGPGAFWGMPYPLHNEYMTTFFEFGLIGLSLLFAYIYHTAKFLILTKNRILGTCFVIACIDIGANFALHIAPTGFLIVIICGLIERERLNR